jgi:peptidoglycan DL-endopeptidase CwlO
VTLDVVVARAAAALGRGHALFSPAPLDGSAGSSQTLTSLSNRIAASPQTLGAQGQFATAYGEVAQQFSGRLSGTAALDAQLSGVVSDAAAANAAGRNQSGSVVNAAAGDTARTGPFTSTPAGQRALLVALRDRVDEQRRVISVCKARDARLAAMVRQLAYRGSAGGGGVPGMLSGLGGMRAPTGGGGSGLGGLSVSNLSGLTQDRGDHNSSAPIGRTPDMEPVPGR